MRMSAAWRRRLIAVGMVLGLTACSSGMQVNPVPPQGAPPFPADVVLAPIRFHEGRLGLRRGQVIARFRDGLECIDGGKDVFWGATGPQSLPRIEFADLFFEQFSAAGYTVLGDPAALFETRLRHRVKPAYLVAARVEDLRATLCEVASLFSWTPRNAQTGVASVRVYWQVFAPLTKDVVYEGRSEGFARFDRPVADALTVLAAEAFGQAAGNFAADAGLRALVQAPRPSRAELVEEAMNTPLWLPWVAPSDLPLVETVDSVRRAVVTVDAESDETGAGHASGFFVAPDLVLTTAAAVEGTDVVRLITVTGRSLLGDVIRRHRGRDAALVRVEPVGDHPLAIRPTPVHVAETVYAIGTPGRSGNRATVTGGIVGRNRLDGRGRPQIGADVAVRAGNAGGPLVDGYGSVIGVALGPPDGDDAARRAEGPAGLAWFAPIGDVLDALALRVRDPNDTRVDTVRDDADDTPAPDPEEDAL